MCEFRPFSVLKGREMVGWIELWGGQDGCSTSAGRSGDGLG